jgi:hypothetical protein
MLYLETFYESVVTPLSDLSADMFFSLRGGGGSL